MSHDIVLKPVEMTPATMQMLEDRGLIIRLCPGHHPLPVKAGEALARSIYESEPRYGPHKLIAVSVNRSVFGNFGTHPDNEEFLLIGDPQARPMYLVVALCGKDALNRKLASGTVSPEDFAALRVRYNDPEVSFFTMLREVPHGEATAEVPGTPATFYVTEPRDMGIDLTPFGDYRLVVLHDDPER